MFTGACHVEPNRRDVWSWSKLVQCSLGWRRTGKTWRLCFHSAPSGGDGGLCAHNPPVGCGDTSHTEPSWRQPWVPVDAAFVPWRHHIGGSGSVSSPDRWSSEAGCWRSKEPRTNHPEVCLPSVGRNASVFNITILSWKLMAEHNLGCTFS